MRDNVISFYKAKEYPIFNSCSIYEIFRSALILINLSVFHTISIYVLVSLSFLSINSYALADGLKDGEDTSGRFITTETGCQISIPSWEGKYITAVSEYKASWSGTCPGKTANGTGTFMVSGSFGRLIFMGNMVNGAMEGQGLLHLPSAETLVGVFHVGNLEGKVSYTRQDGFRYEGDWSENAETGRGNAFYPDGSQYDGEWDHGRMSGKGSMSYSNGSTYHGDWLNQKPSGTGVLTYPNGSEYNGQFLDGHWDGFGKLTIAGGITISGTWSNGQIAGDAEVKGHDGSKYEGSLSNYKRQGLGRLKWSDGSTYIGSWENNLPSGNGIYVNSKGEKFDGPWIQGCFKGDGAPPIIQFCQPKGSQN